MRPKPTAGFTLTELLLTLSLLLLLVGLVAMEYESVKQQRQIAVASEEVHRIRDAVEASRITSSGPDRIPADLSKVPGLEGQELIDPWGRPYQVDALAMRVLSAGPDGITSTPDDLTAPLSPVAFKRKPGRR